MVFEFVFLKNFKWNNEKPQDLNLDIFYSNSCGTIFKLGSKISLFKVIKSDQVLPFKIIHKNNKL